MFAGKLKGNLEPVHKQLVGSITATKVPRQPVPEKLKDWVVSPPAGICPGRVPVYKIGPVGLPFESAQ